jgi:hypothetical protein
MIYIRIAILFISFLTAGCSSRKQLSGSDTISIIPRSAWNALEPKPYKAHTPVRITVHHEGTRLEKTDDAAKIIGLIFLTTF